MSMISLTNSFLLFSGNYPEAIALGYDQCKFKSNPTKLAIKLIESRHQLLPKDSHVASILNRSKKVFD